MHECTTAQKLIILSTTQEISIQINALRQERKVDKQKMYNDFFLEKNFLMFFSLVRIEKLKCLKSQLFIKQAYHNL